MMAQNKTGEGSEETETGEVAGTVEVVSDGGDGVEPVGPDTIDDGPVVNAEVPPELMAPGVDGAGNPIADPFGPSVSADGTDEEPEYTYDYFPTEVRMPVVFELSKSGHVVSARIPETVVSFEGVEGPVDHTVVVELIGDLYVWLVADDDQMTLVSVGLQLEDDDTESEDSVPNIEDVEPEDDETE